MLKLSILELPTCVKLFNIPTIGLLLQICIARCTLHIYCSIVEFIKNESKTTKPHFLK